MSTFEELKAESLKTGQLYEDTSFPAKNTSINPDTDNPGDWLWKRPPKICDSPRFVIDGVSRFDLVQGELGDCWLVAAAAVLATKRDLFQRVVPPDQSFKRKYAGIFRFNFWRFGKWEEVLIDDRLPVTVDGALRFGNNRSQPKEFWGALLEKAYAKLHGSYSAIYSGHIRDALVDFTGGISEVYNLRNVDKLPPDIFEIVNSSFHIGSLLGAGIWSDAGSTTEEPMWNGLYKGHAYSITGVRQCRVQGWHLKLLRLRNPWGQKEWTGAWSDESDEWKALSDDEKKKFQLTFDNEGEFWMTFNDFMDNFHALDIVHLGPGSYARVNGAQSAIQWQESSHHGRWIKGISAGGSGLLSPDKDLYCTNPQYYFILKDPDEDDVGSECTCVVSLMQIGYRKRKVSRNAKRLIVGFDIHQVKSKQPEPLQSATYFDKAQLKKQFQVRTPMREVSCRLQLDPGLYCVVPNTLRPAQEGNFLLRIYTYSKIKSGAFEDDIETGFVDIDNNIKPIGTVSNETFLAYAGEDFVVDARDLRDLLADLGKREFGESLSFGVEACRSFISMHDLDESGRLGFNEVTLLWDELLFWKKVFRKYDKDKSDCIETYELRSTLRDIGYSLQLDTLSALVRRYGGKEQVLHFEDFALCLAKTISLFATFKEFSKNSPQEARLNLDQWLRTMLYL